MRIKVRHQTHYTYAAPARSILQQLRLTPRPHRGQFVRRWRVEVDADARLHKTEDAFGNLSHLIFVEGPVDGLTITIDGEVETEDRNGLVADTIERLPARFFLRDTALTRPTPAIVQYARDIQAAQGGDQLATLHALTGALHRDLAFTPGATSSDTAAGDAFAAATGVCQDFAHIFAAAARVLDVPARYVSGYFLRTDTTAQDAGHAWAEAYLPGLGWVGFDPAHGLAVTDRYVRVAIGCDYLDAAPVRGAQQGGQDEALAVAIDVQEGRRVIEQ
jgi:transglutaminase-like putative cysteine protease